MADKELLTAATNAAATIGAIYEWVARVDAAGGPICLSGIAECNAMLKSLRKNAERTEKLIMEPLRNAIRLAEATE